MHWVVELVCVRSDGEEVSVVDNGGPFGDGGDKVADVSKEWWHYEEEKGSHKSPGVPVKDGDASLFSSRELVLVVVKVVAEEEAIDSKAAEENASWDNMEGDVRFLVEDANHGEANARGNT